MGGSVSVLEPLRSCPVITRDGLSRQTATTSPLRCSSKTSFRTKQHVSCDHRSGASNHKHSKRASLVCSVGKGVFSTKRHILGDPHSGASLRNQSKRASMVCAAGKGTLEPISIHVVLPSGERDTLTISKLTGLDKYLNNRGLGGAILEDSTGKKLMDAELLKDGEEYKVIPRQLAVPQPQPLAATISGVTLQVPDDDGSLVDLVYTTLSQQILDSIMSENDLAGFVDATAKVQMVTKLIDDMSSNGCYTGVPNPRTGLAVRVKTLEVEARNAGNGKEDAAGAKVAKLARKKYPLSSIEPLPVKEFKDAAGKQALIELHGGVVVHTPYGGVLYVVDHKRTLASGDLVKVATLPDRLKERLRRFTIETDGRPR